MKNRSLLFFALGSVTAVCSVAQPTITQSDLPQAGFTYVVSTDTTPTINLGTPGPSAQNWNFTSLTQDYPSAPTYGLTSNTAYASVFPTSNLYTYGPSAMYSSFYGGAPVNGSGLSQGYMFWKTDAAGFWIIGFRADSGNYSNHNVFENPTELLIGTPASYASVHNNSGRWQLDMNLDPTDVDTFYVSTVAKTLTADAWGSLVIASGTFNPVLRIHEHVVKVDSVYARIGGTTIYSLEFSRDTLNNFFYWDNSTHYPVSIVHADKNMLVKKVEYYVTTLNGVSNVGKDEQLAISPNPLTVNSHLSLPRVFATDQAHVRVYNSSGARLYEGKSSVPNDLLPVEACLDLPKGMYLLQITEGSGKNWITKFMID